MSARTRAWDGHDAALATTVAAVAAVCWVLTIRRMQGMGMDMGPGSDLGSFSWFLPTWVIMMAAMMFPSALPAVVSFERTRGAPMRVAQGVVFAAAYLAVWAAFGAVAFLVYRGLRSADPAVLGWDSGGRYLVAATAVAAGLYELTPVKRACLQRCRTAGDRSEGSTVGAALHYAADCVGCSIALMALLLVIGAMSITWMVVIAAILLVEKTTSSGPRATIVSGLGLIALGAWIALDPGSAPGLTIPM
jgi:predicted metal-binding membrane protein